MTTPVLTFFNNKGGVGQTSLVYHLAWMLSDMGYRVLACDLDPQANLTAAFLNEEQLESLWDTEVQSTPEQGSTIMECLQPLIGLGDILSPALAPIDETLSLIPGDFALASVEDALSTEWHNSLRSDNLLRPFRILTGFSSIMQKGAEEMEADIILTDVAPNLGAINRSALIATDYIIVPLGADLFSFQGLKNLGPALDRWQKNWKKQKGHWTEPDFPLPSGHMEPIGYAVRQHGVRLSRPIIACDKWFNRMPAEYARSLLKKGGPYPRSPREDEENALAVLKHYRSLVPMAQEARKPFFHLKAADGAFGGHVGAVSSAREDFRILATKIIDKIGLGKP